MWSDRSNRKCETKFEKDKNGVSAAIRQFDCQWERVDNFGQNWLHSVEVFFSTAHLSLSLSIHLSI